MDPGNGRKEDHALVLWKDLEMRQIRFSTLTSLSTHKATTLVGLEVLSPSVVIVDPARPLPFSPLSALTVKFTFRICHWQ